jgi:hypothetical protein
MRERGNAPAASPVRLLRVRMHVRVWECAQDRLRRTPGACVSVRMHAGTRLCRLRGSECMSVRMHAGQAVVQTVEDKRSEVQYAVKFFVSEVAFQQERALYSDRTQPLGAFLPALHSIVESGGQGLLDAAGHPLPSCIVMEKGESLDLWTCSGDGIDMVTGLQVCCCSGCGCSSRSHTSHQHCISSASCGPVYFCTSSACVDIQRGDPRASITDRLPRISSHPGHCCAKIL